MREKQSQNSFSMLDCTLRDGGYYTNWDFQNDTLDAYLASMESLPIEYIEIGYRNTINKEYKGEFYYCNIDTIKYCKERLKNKRIAMVLDAKCCLPSDVEMLIGEVSEYIDMVRLAIRPDDIKHAIELATKIKELGLIVCFNVMYMSDWDNYPNFYTEIKALKNVDYFYMVDSYGSVTPKQVEEIYKKVKATVNCAIGFHGHNNLELALINTIVALECGCDIVDSTITGMGRGAGNLKTELLLTYLSDQLAIEFSLLNEAVEKFEALKKNFNWGTNLPYMVSGKNSLPQKQVMDWIGKTTYSIDSIVNALHKNKGEETKFTHLKEQFDVVFLVGGGPSINDHKRGIVNFINKRKDAKACIIHTSSKNAKVFEGIAIPQFFILIGNEGKRFERNLNTAALKDFKLVISSSPREISPYLPERYLSAVVETNPIDFIANMEGNSLAIAMQTVLDVKGKDVYFFGFDGAVNNQSVKDFEVMTENEKIIELCSEKRINCISITPSSYKGLLIKSLYSFE